MSYINNNETTGMKDNPAVLAAALLGPRACGVSGGVGGGAAVGHQKQSYDREYMRMHIAGHVDRMVVDSPEEEDDTINTTPWGRLEKETSRMGFNLESEEPWQVLGLQRMEGPENDKVTIGMRAGIINDKMASISDAKLEPQERAKQAKWLSKVEEARAHCLEELPLIQRERKQLKVAKDRLPRWAEATTAVSERIMDGPEECVHAEHVQPAPLGGAKVGQTRVCTRSAGQRLRGQADQGGAGDGGRLGGDGGQRGGHVVPGQQGRHRADRGGTGQSDRTGHPGADHHGHSLGAAPRMP